ncbi:hypothetical protein [Virgibacillus dakarensis]|uniref:hypothetical protein n=1 Tax=Virgibacillus dakarensis TaxID=1917889 RepID=UPI000B43151E|nr:hypothetical protein [Virgibacillus dakarensis]
MHAVNNGKQITITVSFEEAAVLVSAMQKGATAYKMQRRDEKAEEIENMLYTLMNPKVKLD